MPEMLHLQKMGFCVTPYQVLLGLKECITSSSPLICLLILACLPSLCLPPVPGTGRWLTKKAVSQRSFFHLRLSPHTLPV